MMKKIGAIDSHCHADIAVNLIPSFMEEYHRQGIAFISWSYADGIKSWKDYPAYWDNLNKLCGQFRKKGLPAWYLVGIHPRCIPEDMKNNDELPDIIQNSLIKHLDSSWCLGMGEIGLDMASDLEKDVFKLQLDFAEKYVIPAKRIGIHTPRNNKPAVTQEILDILNYYEPLHPFIVVDHVLPETFDMVIESGYMIGITLQEGKASIKDLLDLIRNYPHKMEAVMLNSDCAKDFSRPYLEFLKDVELDDRELKAKLLFYNCCSFFGINKGRV